MTLKQGIDISINPSDKNITLNMKAFPISIANNKPNRKKIIFQQEFTFDSEDPLLQNKILDTISQNINNNFDNSLFTTKNSEAYILLKNSQFADQVIASGSFFREQNKVNHNDFQYHNSPKNSGNNIFLDVDIFSHQLYKSREISISGFDNFNNLQHGESPLFISREIKNKTTNNLHEEFIKSLFVHIENFQKQGKKITINSTAQNIPFISSLNKYLKDNNLEAVSFKVKKNISKNKKEAEQRIAENTLAIYDEMLNVEDKYLIASDGGILFKDTQNEKVSGAFIVVTPQGNIEKQVSLTEKGRNSDFSELFALKESLLYMVENNKIDKPINFVFDSDRASNELQAILADTHASSLSDNKHKDILNEISNIIKLNNIEVDCIVLKSHQSIVQKHDIVKLNDRVDELVKKNNKSGLKYKI